MLLFLKLLLKALSRQQWICLQLSLKYINTFKNSLCAIRLIVIHINMKFIHLSQGNDLYFDTLSCDVIMIVVLLLSRLNGTLSFIYGSIGLFNKWKSALIIIMITFCLSLVAGYSVLFRRRTLLLVCYNIQTWLCLFK